MGIAVSMPVFLLCFPTFNPSSSLYLALLPAVERLRAALGRYTVALIASHSLVDFLSTP